MMRLTKIGNPGDGLTSGRPLTDRISALAVLTAALILAPLSQVLAGGTMPAAAEPCLACHSMPALTKTMANGEKLALHVPREEFAGSVHAMMGCAACHQDVDPKAHPSMKPYDSVRDYTLAKADTCKTCHSAKYEQYQGSIHASLVAGGDAQAPVCSSCHDIHGQKKVKELVTFSGDVCKTCHESIFDAYEGSVHGEARFGTELNKAPICADCHSVHDVTAATASEKLQASCHDCHQDAAMAHKAWLPNSGLHLGSIACASCHSPTAERVVDLRLFDKKSKTLVGETNADPRFVALASEHDKDGDGLAPLELWNFVREANREGIDTSLTLHGRLEVRGEDAHRLAHKSKAVRECDTCHQKDSLVFENVTVSVTAEDGRRIRYNANKETLTSAVSVDSVGNFYTAGGTRIQLLDGLLALAVLAGFGIPMTHMSVRKWFKSKK